MEKQRGIRGLSVIALVVAVLGLTVAFAAMSRTLTIRGTATLDKAEWDVHFEGVDGKSTTESGVTTIVGEATGGASIETAPTINTGTTTFGTDGVEKTDIGAYNVKLTKPGSKVVFTFKIVNNGDINAKIGDSGLTMPRPTFTSLADPAVAADATLVDSKTNYTLTYVDVHGTDNKAVDYAVAAGDTLKAHDYVTVALTIEYDSSATELPTDDVSLTGMNITINYVQDMANN